MVVADEWTPAWECPSVRWMLHQNKRAARLLGKASACHQETAGRMLQLVTIWTREIATDR